MGQCASAHGCEFPSFQLRCIVAKLHQKRKAEDQIGQDRNTDNQTGKSDISVGECQVNRGEFHGAE